MRVLPALLVIAAGCHRSSDAALPVQRAGQGETCAATSDCDTELLCVEATCRTQVSVPVGEYHWAAANLAREKGNVSEAEQGYREALAAFEAEDAVPPELLCDYGAALRTKKSDRAVTERAARLLHRCFAQALVGSSLRRRAARELVALAPLGLDPAVLGRDGVIDGYLTLPPDAPDPDRVTVKVTGEGLDGRGSEAAVALLGSEDAARAVRPCMLEYWKATRKEALELPVAVVFRARYDDFDERYTGGTLALEPAPGLAGPELATSACVTRALAETTADFGSRPRGTSFKGTARFGLAIKR